MKRNKKGFSGLDIVGLLIMCAALITVTFYPSSRAGVPLIEMAPVLVYVLFIINILERKK